MIDSVVDHFEGGTEQLRRLLANFVEEIGQFNRRKNFNDVDRERFLHTDATCSIRAKQHEIVNARIGLNVCINCYSRRD